MFLPYIFAFLLGFQTDVSQYTDVEFHPPVKIPMFLAGNFCELRANHFHTGIDIKTQGKEGFNIYAIEDGYVSRINISHWGYGTALYVDHPNGLTSVYAHLKGVNEEIDAFLEKAQYQKKSETIELYPGKDQLKVKKGDVIAYSGNTGSSGGPHLHFEIRETESENALNPLLFDFNIKDDVKPTIKAIRIYSEDLNYKKAYSVKGSRGSYQISNVVSIPEKAGIGLQAFDMLSGVGNHCGIYSVKLYLDEDLIYYQEMDFMDFSVNRYINNHMDYEEFTKNKSGVHKCFIHGHNELPIYKKMKSRGVIALDDNKIHSVRMIVKDVKGNASFLKFKVRKSSKIQSNTKEKSWSYLDLNQIDSNGMKVLFPIKTFYSDIDLKYSKIESSKYLSDIHYVGGYYLPVHTKFDMSIDVDENKLKRFDSSKLLICYMNAKGRVGSMGGIYQGGKLTVKSKKLGKFFLYYDTTKPFIKDINKDSIFSQDETIDFRITDNLSGIKTYDIEIDGKWVLANYFRRSNKLKLNVKKAKITKGFHDIKVKVVDERVILRYIHKEY